MGRAELLKVLYAGDSPVGGPANYLLGVLKRLNARVTHLAPSEVLRPRILQRKFDVIIFSDFSRNKTPLASQKLIAGQVKNGAGFLMVGGWGSFAGPYGGWRGSLIEKLLPVSCLHRDDRVNFPSGALIVAKHPHPLFRASLFKSPPMICGLNQIQPKKESQILLSARKIVIVPSVIAIRQRSLAEKQSRTRIALDSFEYPLLVIDSHPNRRIAALTTDAAPHWCGGLLDWGTKHVTLPVPAKNRGGSAASCGGKGGITITVGNAYLEFFSSLILWLAGH